jgi:hypothetical protein
MFWQNEVDRKILVGNYSEIEILRDSFFKPKQINFIITNNAIKIHRKIKICNTKKQYSDNRINIGFNKLYVCW